MTRSRFLTLGLMTALASGEGRDLFYPEGHFDRVEKVRDYGLFLDYISDQIDAGKTVFARWIASEGQGCCRKQAPSWNDVTRMFEGNPDVAFADINLEEAPMIKGEEIGDPGKGGWPTIRYFNQHTGMFGDAYKKVTNKPMCEELGDRMMMIDYVESYSGSVLCGIDGRNCNEKETNYLGKWKDKPLEELKIQLTRLKDMTSKPMNEELLEWAWRRMRILMKLIDATKEPAEAEL